MEKSANLGNENSLIRLGIIYLLGEVVEKDLEKSVQYISKAVAKGGDIPKILLKMISDEIYKMKLFKRVTLFIHFFDRSISSLEIETSATVSHLKSLVKLKTGIDVELQILKWKGLNLEDGEPLFKYGIQSGEIVQLFLRVKGGGKITVVNKNKKFQVNIEKNKPLVSLQIKLERELGIPVQYQCLKLSDDSEIPTDFASNQTLEIILRSTNEKNQVCSKCGLEGIIFDDECCKCRMEQARLFEKTIFEDFDRIVKEKFCIEKSSFTGLDEILIIFLKDEYIQSIFPGSHGVFLLEHCLDIFLKQKSYFSYEGFTLKVLIFFKKIRNFWRNLFLFKN